jgi:hypothetical protein
MNHRLLVRQVFDGFNDNSQLCISPICVDGSVRAVSHNSIVDLLTDADGSDVVGTGHCLLHQKGIPYD